MLGFKEGRENCLHALSTLKKKCFFVGQDFGWRGEKLQNLSFVMHNIHVSYYSKY